MSALLGDVQRELPSHAELQTIQEFMLEISHSESFPGDVAGPVRAVRFLRGRLGNKQEAVQFFKAMLEWRVQETRFNVNGLRASVAGLSFEEYQRHYAAKLERRYLPGAFLGRSRMGGLVFFSKGGMFDIEGMLQEFGEHAFMKHEVEKMEWVMWSLHKCCNEEQQVPYLVNILDLEGASRRLIQGKSRNALGEAVKSLSTFYVDATEVNIVINAPWVFRIAWAMFSPLLTERQQAKMRILGSSADATNRAALHATVSPDLLPPSLGGCATLDLWGEDAQKRVSQALVCPRDANASKKGGSDAASWFLSCCLVCGPRSCSKDSPQLPLMEVTSYTGTRDVSSDGLPKAIISPTSRTVFSSALFWILMAVIIGIVARSGVRL